MTEESQAEVVEVDVASMSEKDRTAEIMRLAASGDYKAIAAFSRKIDSADKAKEKAELAEKRAALDLITGTVAEAITKALAKIIDSGQLDAADGIWYSHDFGEAAATVRLMKSAPRKAGTGGGGGGKKFDVSTDDMLSRHGEEEYKDGISFQQAYESNTDKNHRYAIRTKLLKLEGVL